MTGTAGSGFTGNSVFWGDDTTVRRGYADRALTGFIGDDSYPYTVFSTNLTGFAIGTQYANAFVLARGQPQPMSFALDGTGVYWTTSRCDIEYLTDSPQ